MNSKDFDDIVAARIAKIQAVLSNKAVEYASYGDRLHNFKVAAQLESEPSTPEKALWGMLKKHLVSLIDIVDDTELGGCPSDALRDEKIGDSINYLILLEAMLIERREHLIPPC